MLATLLVLFLFFISNSAAEIDNSTMTNIDLLPSKNIKVGRLIPAHYYLEEDIMSGYKKALIPKVRREDPINVSFSIQLYQIIQVNEPQQFLLLNAWVVESWTDQMLGWNESIHNDTEILVRHDDVWLPDTTLYNSLEMDDSAARKLTHVKLTNLGLDKGAKVDMLYPTIYKISCLLNLKFFPFDLQKCRMTFGSWSYDNTLIDYYPLKNLKDAIGLSNFLENDAWSVVSTHVIREEKKYECCPNNYTMLNYHIIIRRKPLYYVLNLIAPTAVITFISIIGFFTSSSVHDLRQEKITLGITTLLSMSIMIFMVSDKMPSTSTCVPLIGIFYTLMITIISLGTLAASAVIFIQKLGGVGIPPSPSTMKWTHRLAPFVWIEMPLVMKQAYAKKAKEEKIRKRQLRKESMWSRVYKIARDSSRTKLSTATTPNFKISLPHEYEPKKESSITTMTTAMDESLTIESFTAPIDDIEMLNRKTINHSESSQSLTLKPVEVQVSPHTTRNIVELEWDWVAAVAERCFLVLFIILFLFSSIGVNLIVTYSQPVERDDFKAFITSSYFYPKSKSLGDNSLALVMLINQHSKNPRFNSLIQPEILIDADNGTNSMMIKTNYTRVTPHAVCNMITVFATVQLLPNTNLIYLHGNNGSVAIPFEIPPSVQRDVVVCISPLFISEQWQNFLFAVHIYKKFGAFVNLYLISAVDSFYYLMKEYEDQDYLTVQPWISAKFHKVNPDVADPYNDVEFRNQAGSQTDCLLKYKESAKYVTFLDLDDVLIPRLAPTYLEEFRIISRLNPGKSMLHYHKENHAVTTVSNSNMFSFSKMFRSLKHYPVQETGKIVLDPRYLNFTWIHWPPKMPDGLTKIIVDDNSITHLKKIRWMEDYSKESNQSSKAHPILNNIVMEEIEEDWMRMKNASKVVSYLPKHKFYFNVIRQCYDKKYYSLHYSGRTSEIKCPGPQLCDYPQRDEIECMHVDANYASVPTIDPITFYYATNHKFSKDIGCLPH
ncbi:unnamed protein product [Caenorhabditis angaria]|uniref:Uncharacterized protein n=1 Tax=Caenorhabditis angaria TaxID=860376 RepID=A0A9P1ITX6_9PELO|nr:unnamed protein product [Caenorhabditis angaria]